jgi:opacity protein-like surface antigen
MKRFLAAAALVLAAVGPAAAESKFKVYGMLAYVSPLAESDQDVGGVTDAVQASSEMGYNLGIEFRASPLLGVELDYLYSKHDLEAKTAGFLGETAFRPISATLNLHLPVGPLDVYGGPTASWVNWGDIELPSGGEVEFDAEFAYGLSAGLDLPLAPAFALTGGLRWLSLEAEGDNVQDLQVDPLFTRIGVAMKF